MPARLVVKRPADFLPFETQAIEQAIHLRFEDRVRTFPDRIAIEEDGVRSSYAELNGWANSVAQAILSRCGTGLAQTAILLPNSGATIATMLGSLKARKAYVPLDCSYPEARLRAMHDDAEPAVLITDQAHRELAERVSAGRTPILDASEIARDSGAPNPGIAADPLERAYILYTSGTTGRPKGIAFLHRNLLHTTMCLTNQLFFSPSDRVTWLHSPSFGSSVVDIYCCLANGGTLFPWDLKTRGFAGMAEWLLCQRITTLQWIPSAFRQLMRTVPDGFRFPDARIAVMAGEPLTRREVELFRRHFPPGSHLVNQVGTAESYNYHLYCIDHEIPIEEAGVSGGYPVSPEREVLILGEGLEPLPPGGIGEIAIRSNYMSAGYWRNDEATRAKFVRVVGGDTPVYLTGDMGTLDADGCLTHLGRKDFQLKVRGCRIETAEVEHLLAQVAGVADCACWVAKNLSGEDLLVAYVVPKSSPPFVPGDAERFLESRLPRAAVPRHYVLLEALPCLPGGKIDRKALPSPFAEPDIERRTKPVEFSPAQHKIQAIFEEVLQLNHVSADAEFFAEGGDSLSLAVLQHRLARQFGIELPMDRLSGSLTPAGIAQWILGAPRLAPSSSRGNGGGHSGPESAAPAPAAASAPAPKAAGSLSRMPSQRPGPTSPSGTGLKDLIIISAGRLGREVLAWACQSVAAGARYRIKGFLDDRAGILDGCGYAPGIVGNVRDYEIQPNDVFIGAIGDPGAKLDYYRPIAERGGEFVNVIHPTAIAGEHVRLGQGIVLAPYTVLTAEVTVGDHVSIGTFSNIAHDATIGSWAQIASHCGVNGCATVGEGAFLGSHVCVAPEIVFGDWAFAGAGSVVVRDVPPGAKVLGNPAVVVGAAATVGAKTPRVGLGR